MTFGEKVRAARKERGLSQKELAARTHIAVRTIINYESGSRMPKSKDSYVRLAEVLDIDLASLMDENAEFTIQASEKYGSRGRRQAEKLVKDLLRPGKKPVRMRDEKRNALLNSLSENLKAALGTKVMIHQSGKNKGKIEIEYYSDAELDRLYELLPSVR